MLTMRRPRRTRYLLYSLVVTCVVARIDVGRAQQPPAPAPPPAPGAAPSTQAAPPIIQFAPEGISLEQAVQVTLQNDPNIKLAEADVALKQGITQEQTGLFDSSVNGTASWSHTITELTDSAKQNEQKKRDDLQGIINAGPANISLAQQNVNLLTGIENGTVTDQQLSATSPTLAASLIELDALIGASPAATAAQLRSTRQSLLDNA